VPTAFLPGIVGQLYRQFALTIAIATVFSSINALTLSPALAGVLLRPPSGKGFIGFRIFNALFDRLTGAYGAIVRLLIRLAIVAVPASIAILVVSFFLYGRIPTGFIPQEDEGWCIVNVQLPPGASFQRTDEVLTRLASQAQEIPGIRTVIAVTGYSMIDGAASSSRGVLFVIFENWDERGTESHQSRILQALNGRFISELDAVAMAFPLPSLPGLGTSGGLAAQLEDLTGAGPEALADVTASFIGQASQDPSIGVMFTSFDASSPQLFVDIDREQMETLALSPRDVFGTLGAALGSAYVNDFTAFGKTFQVRLQSRADQRATPEDIRALDVRNANGDMVPFGSFARVVEQTGPAVVSRHNVYTAAKVISAPAPGVPGSQTMDAVERLGRDLLGDDYGIEWTELAYQQKAASGSAGMVFAFGLLLVYLVLAAQYESWTLPISVCLSVPLAFLGVALGLLSRGLQNDVYAQIGLVLLIGLAAKSAILIVEFARDLRAKGRPIREAALEASTLRFRAILMTALSFVLGVIPLAVASGAGAESRIALGTTVLGGMVAATLFGVFLVPVFYVVVQGTTEGLAKMFRRG
ncbi:MAG: efflux RND transporter permease subunit, partial [Phycisphaerales bacterium]|nr:efflux RND transporter permease subunit [Phycisphaerales bacterium]